MQNLELEDKKVVFMPEESLDKGIGYFIIKRIIDVFGSLVGIIFLSPVMLIVIVAIKLDSKGPIIFSQKRVGQNGRIFNMYKFRSMVENAERLLGKLQDKNEMSGPMFKMSDDPRITKVGRFIRKTSLDELPQLFNVLRGHMSLVGPRPNLPNEVKEFNEFQKRKFMVKPGLTCYWQVMGRSSIGFEEWIELDLKYIKERSTFVDLKLIFRTFFLLFGDKNAM
ncbi:exopolysaccharide biosynthesis polyprenyl glycosylphosphotransferase [Clostridium acetobutylicum]|uniref:Sugar transferase involved in lipopolysaccharide synthesis n=1 Tax=Clostridium acetobutylicum (strain ATCC 824 / DSM 792 / JCM 1419 / IAM 19013 / LMG 5710 / NBRC 13948 / NRRL B-527 / VKM B-1787 / 2291 / W) TaxID=272562 RepID=Q97EN5_CLOAB|nr:MULTISPECIES: sugar transferase [Clostridium]AAK81013.1 Sugar transferase involved in lipopolysaccharide synthesis [Clostridium acetobutylicum ATCC 824]ADZ22116.1 Sugar transferase [Clostridium acetobutylicum EA 2018]AEI33172.1 sugar transferase involved in lipopolysaccharide synthesis [Clostridium acetobutylicum DSM 1731]AWV78576.1 sugar transferase [Clostridium acetobutylicum]KHD35733.1 multidrug MFS transporter [Clostridium acetobutylicum]